VELNLKIPGEFADIVKLEHPIERMVVMPNSSREVSFILNTEKFGSGIGAFNIIAITDDYIPPPEVARDSIYRPYDVKQYRETVYRISVEILQPPTLDVNADLLIFDRANMTRVLHCSNNSKQDVNLTYEMLEYDPREYKITFTPGAVKPGKTLDITLESFNMSDNESIKELRINFEKDSKEITLYKRQEISSEPDVIYEKIVAIDFGTQKTAAAYVDMNEYYIALQSNEKQTPQVNMIALERASHATRYAIPSCIAYDGAQVLIGTPAEGSTDTIESCTGMKMRLRANKIEFHKGGEVTLRDTREVITDFLRQVKTAITREIGEGNYLYVFTLPVLDDDENFAGQKAITLECARRAGFCAYNEDEDNLMTVTEPEAAMFYIINVMSANPRDPRYNLRSGDIIGVFDYGGGTLDICFGKYKLTDGQPSVDIMATIGRYGDVDEQFDLGGNRLDKNMALSVCDHYKQLLVLDSPEYDADNRLINANGFDSISLAFQSEPWHRFVQQIIRPRKEELSEHWENKDSVMIEKIDMDPPLPGEGIVLSSKMFESVVYRDLNYAVKSMRDIINSMRINMKCMFLVGGSSLIKIIKTRLEREIGTVAGPYDYSPGDYDKVKESAIYTVVRGAALSYLTRMSEVFLFDVRVYPKLYPGVGITYRVGEEFRPKSKRLSRRVANGEWLISVVMSNSVIKTLGSFTVSGAHENMPVTIHVRFENRYLEVSYDIGVGETAVAVQKALTYEVYI
jgi:hypothetical protein